MTTVNVREEALKELEERVSKIEEKVGIGGPKPIDANGKELKPWYSVVQSRISPKFFVLVTGGTDKYLTGIPLVYSWSKPNIQDWYDPYDEVFKLNDPISAIVKKHFDC